MPASQRPVRRLTVLYDAACPLCTQLRGWLERRRQLVPLDLVPAGSERAERLLPGLDHAATLEEITVVGDGGQVYRGTAAWITALWALDGYRALAHRLATTASGARLARGAALAATRLRESSRQWGGASYPAADGWRYEPRTGWVHEPPGYGTACPADG
ncbi:thiol-disulfide oxidoreductase DCC family protein [Streptomyces sp. NPDC058373]|uniref:thiol-disulfide oxidoreductase DCC family protein n=1 Tax=unclassified Streptomyces TaxID=2593676 RepID=UPI003651EB24